MASQNLKLSWFLAQLKPNVAKIADKNLKRQGFKTFLPMEEVTRKRKGKFVNVTRPLFPGYIFVTFDLAQNLWPQVNSTFGITRLVSFGTSPASVPMKLVSQLMLRCDTSGKLLPANLLKPGDQVRLNTGPFADFLAEIERVTPDRRVWVLMDVMGGQKRLAVNPEQITVS